MKSAARTTVKTLSVRLFFSALAAISFLTPGCYKASEATVNGQLISSDDFHSALKLAQGHKVMQKLIVQKLIEEEGARQKVVVTDEEMAPFVKEIEEHTNDESLVRLLRQEVHAQLVLRKLLLKDIGAERLVELYGLFRDDLEERELHVLNCASREEANEVRASLKAGTAFNVLAASHGKYQADKQGGFAGRFRRAEIKRRWGPALAEQIILTPAQTALPPFEQEGDFVIIYVGTVFSSFEELTPTLEAMIVDSKRPELVYRLLTQAKISSPYLVDPKRLPNTTLYDHTPYPWESFRVQSQLNPTSETKSQTPTSDVAPAVSPAPEKI